MAKCEICGKRTRVGNNVTRRGIAKKKGGIGLNITGRSKRRFRPNIQRVRVVIGATAKRINACARCLKSDKIVKRSRGGQRAAAAARSTS